MSSSAALNYAECEEMLKTFRCQDLVTLLSFAGQSKNGKKSELYDRCIQILRRGSPNIYFKIKEIHSSRLTPTSANSYNNLMSAVNSNSNSSTSNSPDPTAMLNGRYQPANILNQPIMSNVYNPAQAVYPPNSFNPLIHLQIPPTNHYSMSTGATRSNQSIASGNHIPNIRVQFEKLAFYEHIADLLIPIRLIGANQTQRPLHFMFKFSLNQEQVNEIINNRETQNGKFEFTKQVHLRFGFYENTSQKDNLPANLVCNVNGKPAQLPTPKPTSKPNADIIRPGRSIDITHLIRLAPNMSNNVELNWTNLDQNKIHCVGVYLFRKVTVASLVNYLKQNCTKDAELTRKMVREKLQISDSDFEIETNTYKVSLQCPLMKFRIQLPGRAITCKHVQCFDIESYLMMNEKKPTWTCPVCDQYTPFDNLFIDSLFKEILTKINDCEEIQFNSDAEWSKVTKNNEKKNTSFTSNNLTKSNITNNNNSNINNKNNSLNEDSTDDNNLSPNKSNLAGVKKLEDSIVDICDDSFSSTTGQANQAEGPSTAGKTSQPVSKAKEVFIDLTIDSDTDDEQTISNNTNVNKQNQQAITVQSTNQVPNLKQSISYNQTLQNQNSGLNESLNDADNVLSPSVSIISLSSSDSGSRSQTPTSEQQANKKKSSPISNSNMLHNNNINNNIKQQNSNLTSRQPLSVDTMRSHVSSSVTSPVSSIGSSSSTLPNLSPLNTNMSTPPPPINTPPASCAGTSNDSASLQSNNSRLARDYSSPKRTASDAHLQNHSNTPKQTSSLASVNSIITNTNITDTNIQNINNTNQRVMNSHLNNYNHPNRPVSQSNQQHELRSNQNLNHNNFNTNNQQIKEHGLISSGNKINKPTNRQQEYVTKEKALRTLEEVRPTTSPNLMDTDSSTNLNYRLKESSLGVKIGSSLAKIDTELNLNKMNHINRPNPIRPSQMNPQNRMHQSSHVQPQNHQHQIRNSNSNNNNYSTNGGSVNRPIQTNSHMNSTQSKNPSSNSQPFFINNKNPSQNLGNTNGLNTNTNSNNIINSNQMRSNSNTPNKSNQQLSHSPNMIRSSNSSSSNSHMNQYHNQVSNIQNTRQYTSLHQQQQLQHQQQNGTFNSNMQPVHHSNHHFNNQSIQNR